ERLGRPGGSVRAGGRILDGDRHREPRGRADTDEGVGDRQRGGVVTVRSRWVPVDPVIDGAVEFGVGEGAATEVECGCRRGTAEYAAIHGSAPGRHGAHLWPRWWRQPLSAGHRAGKPRWPGSRRALRD